MGIPFYRPPRLPLKDLERLLGEVRRIFASGIITNGEHCRKLEEEIGRLYSADYVITCSSATQGLQLALWALNASKTLLVLPAFTWKSVDYITQGYERSWLDIDRETWLPVPSEPTWRVNTFLINQTFGSVLEWQKQGTNDKVIFDAAYSLGADIKDFGDITVMSMTATKNVTSCEGGLILTNEEKLAEEMAELRDKCSRMSEINAATGLAYLKHLDDILDRKKQIFQYYRNHLPFESQTIPQSTSYGYYGMLMSSTEERDALVKRLEGKVETRVRYEPLKSGLPNTEYVHRRIVVIPSFAGVDEKKVVELIMECLEK